MGDKCGDKCKLMRPKAPRVGDKWETSVNSCGPRHPEWETSVGDKWETSVEDKCGRQVWETSVGDKWESSVNSCGPRHPEWETSVEDKWEQVLMLPKAPRVREQEWETRGTQVQTRAAQGTLSGRQVRKTSGRQV